MSELIRVDRYGVTCYEITHAGEGERGRMVEVLGFTRWRDPEWFAQQAAEYFDDAEMQSPVGGREPGDFDGGLNIIEVADYYAEPVRFQVSCTVVRQYEAEPIGD